MFKNLLARRGRKFKFFPSDKKDFIISLSKPEMHFFNVGNFRPREGKQPYIALRYIICQYVSGYT